MKWGYDGAEQNRYKQKFSEEQCSDESLFSISIRTFVEQFGEFLTIGFEIFDFLNLID